MKYIKIYMFFTSVVFFEKTLPIIFNHYIFAKCIQKYDFAKI